MKVTQLLEIRQPALNYKETRAKEKLSRVTLELEGGSSSVITRLAKRYDKIDELTKALRDKRDEVNESIKVLGDELFDAEDALVTRVIETVSYTLMLTAAEKAEQKKPTEKINFEAAYGELLKLVPELEEKAKEILKKYTELVPPKDTPVKLTVKAKIKEGLLDSLKSAWRSFIDSLKNWGRSYDSKLEDIKKKFQV